MFSHFVERSGSDYDSEVSSRSSNETSSTNEGGKKRGLADRFKKLVRQLSKNKSGRQVGIEADMESEGGYSRHEDGIGIIVV